MSVLLSIRPEFAEKILAGEKRFEFRRVMPKQRVERVVIYASSPTCRLVGEFTVRRVLSAPPERLWRQTRSHAGIPRHYFDAYFNERTEAHAFEIDEVLRYDQPIDPVTICPSFRPPQSFVYLERLDGFERHLSSAA
ncbi:MAG: ASCH domain-containing protein [Myxococcota bacterium]